MALQPRQAFELLEFPPDALDSTGGVACCLAHHHPR